MTTCDHGIRLDRFCGDCESGFTFRDTPDDRRWSGLALALCFLALAAIVAMAFLKGGVR